MRTVSNPPIPIPGGASTKIISANPDRVCLLITWDSLFIAPSVWPEWQTAQYGIGPSTGTNAILINRGLYLGTCEDDWYAWSSAPLTIYTIETLRD